MDLRFQQVFFGSFCMVTLLQVAGSISFTGDIPDRTIKARLDDDVALGWGFSYNDLGGNPGGPFGAPDVSEISFGIYKSIHSETFLSEKLVVVNSGGNFSVQDGFDRKMDWSHSKYKLTFILKNIAIQDQGMYGVNVELGLSQLPLKDSVIVIIPGLSYVVQNGSSIVRKESAYMMEPFELSFTRSDHDQTADRFKYTLKKDTTTIFIIGKNRGDNELSCFHYVSQKPTPCSNDSFSVNETYVSFKLRNVTFQDAGRYLCIKYSSGLYNTTFEEIDLKVLERPTVTPSAKSSYSGKPNSTQATTVTTNTSPKGSTNPAVIAGVVFAAVIVVFLIVFLVVFCVHPGFRTRISRCCQVAYTRTRSDSS